MPIRYDRLGKENFDEQSLDRFLRHQTVEECWRNQEGEWRLLPIRFLEDWSLEQRREIAGDVAKHMETDQTAFGAWDENRVVGFVTVAHRLFGRTANYAELVCFQVSEDYRGQGIGRQLFALAAAEADRLGADKLYISAHSSKESQAAYRALGCVPAKEINEALAAEEPCDVQMEYVLTGCAGGMQKGAGMKVFINTVTPELFLTLYTSVGWEPPCREQVARALLNTPATFVAYDGEEAVGMVRLIGDGGMSFYVKDFVVVPEYQGRGVGSLLLSELKQYLLRQIEPGWAVSLELISTKEAVAFYEKHGFEQRPCDWDGPGMFQMVWRSELQSQASDGIMDS